MPIPNTIQQIMNDIAFARDVLAELRGFDLRPPLNRNEDLRDKTRDELEEILLNLQFCVGIETLKQVEDARLT